MGSDAQPHPVRLVDDRRQLFTCHLRRLGILPLDRTCAGRHQLHEVGAGRELLAHRRTHLPRTVRLAVHRPEDEPAGCGRRDDAPAAEDARAVEEAELDGLSEHEPLVVEAPDVSHRRDARPEKCAGSQGEHEVAELPPAGCFALQRLPRPESRTPADVAREVDVSVDQPRHERLPSEVERAGRRLPARGTDFGDTAVGHRDRDAVASLPTSPVEQTRVPEDDRARLHRLGG